MGTHSKPLPQKRLIDVFETHATFWSQILTRFWRLFGFSHSFWVSNIPRYFYFSLPYLNIISIDFNSTQVPMFYFILYTISKAYFQLILIYDFEKTYYKRCSDGAKLNVFSIWWYSKCQQVTEILILCDFLH